MHRSPHLIRRIFIRSPLLPLLCRCCLGGLHRLLVLSNLQRRAGRHQKRSVTGPMAPTRPACRPALETLRHYKAPSRPACRLALEPDAPDTRIYSLALCRGMLHLFATDTGRHKALPLFGHRDSHAQYCHNLFLWHAQWAILEMQTNH